MPRGRVQQQTRGGNLQLFVSRWREGERERGWRLGVRFRLKRENKGSASSTAPTLLNCSSHEGVASHTHISIVSREDLLKTMNGLRQTQHSASSNGGSYIFLRCRFPSTLPKVVENIDIKIVLGCQGYCIQWGSCAYPANDVTDLTSLLWSWVSICL